MSKFCKAYLKLEKLEGGYLKDMDGETYGGIVRKFWPESGIWWYVDREKPLRNGQYLKDQRAKTVLVKFYLENYWKSYFELINDQKVVTFIFSQYVNMGRKGIMLAQRAAGVEQDGIMGPITAKAINDDPDYLLKLERANRVYYRLIAMRYPDKRIYLPGWNRRIDILLG